MVWPKAFEVFYAVPRGGVQVISPEKRFNIQKKLPPKRIEKQQNIPLSGAQKGFEPGIAACC
jgi:hypothetical protein